MSRKAGPRCFAVGLLWVCAMAGAARGQQPAAPGAAKVVIRLTDQSSTVVAGAQIQVAPLPERVPEKMQTDEKGELRLELKAGGYGLVVREPGFRVVITHIEVHGRGELEVFPLTLQVANMGGPVMVEGSQPVKDELAIAVVPFNESFLVTRAQLKALPRKTVTVRNGHSNMDENYEGVALAELLSKYGAPLGKDLRGYTLAYYIVAIGADGYQAVLSLAEVDPSFHPGEVLVADTMDGKPLDARSGPFKLLVSEDKRPARWVRNLVSLQVKSAQ